jgi:hypothetical protein
LSEVIRLVDEGEGVHFGDLVAALCPAPDTADQALAELLATAATLLDESIDRQLSQWEPLIAAIPAIATNARTPTELAAYLDALFADYLDALAATTNWAALAAALRRVLAGDRDRERLCTDLDAIDTAILTAVLDRLPHHPAASGTGSSEHASRTTDPATSVPPRAAP